MTAIRRHTWTIVTDELDAPEILDTIFPGRSAMFCQPDGTVLRTVVTYDPITEAQSDLLKQSPEERPAGIRGLGVTSIGVDKLVDPTVTTEKEREYLLTFFQGIADQLAGTERLLTGIMDLFPGLHVDALQSHTQNAQSAADSLADYMRHATDEEWKK